MGRVRALVAVFYVAAVVAFFAVWLSAWRKPKDLRAQPTPYQALERALLRFKLGLLDTPPPSKDVVVVAFKKTANKIWGGLPWPRAVYARLVVNLRRFGAKTIALNMTFADPQRQLFVPAIYQGMYPALPLEKIQLVNPFHVVYELTTELGPYEKALRTRVAADKDNAQLAAKLEAFVTQKKQLLALAKRVARGGANRSFEQAMLAKRDVVFSVDYSTKPKFFGSSSKKEKVRTRQIARLAPSALALPAGVGADISAFKYVLPLYRRLASRRPLVGINDLEGLQYPFAARARLLARVDQHVFASSIVHAVAHFRGGKVSLERGDEGAPLLRVADKRVQLDADGSYPLAYYEDKTFPQVVDAMLVLREKKRARAAVAGKLVIVDIRTPQTSAYHREPTPIRGKLWVGDIKATLASNIIAGHRGPTVHRPAWLAWIEGSCIWLFGALFALLAFRVSLVYSFAVALALVGGVTAVDLLLFMPAKLWLSSGVLVVEIPLLMVANVAAQYLIQRSEKARVRRAFGFYLPEAVLEHMLEDEGALQLGGERRELSILFSDIRGFTSVSEASDPEALGEALNVHLTKLTEAVFDERGTLDKYMGDCIMAFFGAPVPLANHALSAVRAALEMQRRLRAIHDVWREKCGKAVDIGVGVASGDVIVGNMGSEKLFDYTVIGDNVNLSSRLEGLTKVYGVEVLVSEQTARAIEGEVALLEVDRVRVKGKSEPVAIFEAICEGEPDETRARYNGRCEAALAAYRAGDLAAARAAFAEAAELRPDAKLPALYAERIDALDGKALPHDWDGVTDFDHK